MSRKGVAAKRTVIPDPKFGNTVIAKFITRMMLDGKKSISTRIMYEALDVLSKKSDKSHVEAFETALENVKPMVEVKSRRVGGSTYQVPVEIRDSRREALAMRWLIQAARSRSGKSMGEKLGAELLDAFNSTGTAFKKKRRYT